MSNYPIAVPNPSNAQINVAMAKPSQNCSGNVCPDWGMWEYDISYLHQ